MSPIVENAESANTNLLLALNIVLMLLKYGIVVLYVTTRHCRTLVKGRTDDDDDSDSHAVSLNCVATSSFLNLLFFSVSCVSTPQNVICR
jgi:hypothetical protein